MRAFVLAATALAAIALSLVPAGRGAAQADIDVDLELVLAVDISYSMDPDELALQRNGYVEAFRSDAIVKAIQTGAVGKIAVTYVEWAGVFEQRIVAPWTLIDGKASADAFAQVLAGQPLRRAYRTSIAGVIDYAVPLFGKGFEGTRKVIDISGDGANNQGRPVLMARADALARGITINGLPVLLKRPGYLDLPELDVYYKDCVIGGQGAFVVPIREHAQFAEAIRTKLLLEIADLTREPLLQHAQIELRQKTDCEIGEKQWRERWERN